MQIKFFEENYYPDFTESLMNNLNKITDNDLKTTQHLLPTFRDNLQYKVLAKMAIKLLSMQISL